MNFAELFRITLPETALEAAALLVLIVDLAFLREATVRMRARTASLIGVLGCIASLCLLSKGASSVLHAPDGAVILSSGGVVAFLQFSVLVLTALTLLLLFDTRFNPHSGEFAAILLMAASGALLVVSARDLLVIFVGLELLSLGLYVLTAFAKRSALSAESALKYYLFGGMSAAFLLFGFSYIYGLSGSTHLDQINFALAASGPSPLFYVAWIFIVAGLSFKVAAAPFHLWAPDVYQGAPTPAAAFIASVSKVAGFGLLLSFSYSWLMPAGAIAGQGIVSEQWILQSYRTWQPLVVALLILAALSMVLGNLAALVQDNVRRLLAYSAVAHVGYILLGVAVKPVFSGQDSALPFLIGSQGTVERIFDATAYYVVSYGLTAIAAFAVVGLVERSSGSSNLDAFLGLHRRNPLLAAVLLVSFFSLAGIPPLVGFWAKFNLFAAVLRAGAGVVPFSLVVLAVGMSCVSLYYYLQVLKRVYVMPAVNATPIRLHIVTYAVLLLMSLAIVLLGCFPASLQSLIANFR